LVDEALHDLVPRWQRYWPTADIERIAADVRARLAAAVDAWDLPSPEPLTGGVGALTCAAGHLVVKVLPRFHPEEQLLRGEGEALAHWRETGAIARLLDRRDDGMTLLLERVEPATSLDDAPYDEQLIVAGELVRRLHAAGAPPATLPPIDAYVQPYRAAGRDPELDALLADSPPPVAVHADLHGGNVLLDGERWVAIDPKGVAGDPHLDVWLLLCPQAPPLPEDRGGGELRRRIEIYSHAAGLDPVRATRWVGVIARAEAVLSADSAFPSWPDRLRGIAGASRVGA
jgi:streptomycin 6-kinase